MDTVNRCFGLFTGLVLIGKKVAFSGIFAFSFLTTWGIIFVVTAMMVGCIIKEHRSFRARALSLAWIVTFSVIMMYWGYLFPRVNEKIDLNVVLSHGGLLPFVTIEIFHLGEGLHQSSQKDVLIFTALYTSFILLPLGLSGHPVYPGLAFDGLGSWLVVLTSALASVLGNNVLKSLTYGFKTEKK